MSPDRGLDSGVHLTFLLALCALWTYLWFDGEWYQRLFRIVLDVARAKPEWQWVLATDRLVAPADLGALPRNAIACETVPQRGLLQRARMMITHGGTNTIRECAYFGVPMVIFFLGGDHPGNTALVVYHGLGVKGDLRRLSVRSLKKQVEAVDRSFYIQSQMRLHAGEGPPVRGREARRAPHRKLASGWRQR